MLSKNLNKLCYKCLKGFRASEERVHGLHPHCFQEWFQLPKFVDFQDLALKPQDKESHDPLHISTSSPVNASFFQGKFKKYSARLNEEDYILKVEQSEYPELPATEYLCNQMANSLNIKIPEYYFIRFENSLDTFVVKNFMQKIYGGNLVHIYHYLKKPGDFNCQTLLHIIQEKTGHREDMVHFIQMCLFDALIGNDDRHGRNFGLIQTVKGLTLAPIYDNPSYLAREEEWLLEADHNPRGTIGTQATKEPTMKEYIMEFKRLGFKDIINKFQKSVKLENLFILIEAAFISQKRKEALKNLISKRYREMSDE